MNDLDTERFEKAQSEAYSSVIAELHRGKKETHWMWFIFPQLRGLGQSSNSHYYGIPSLQEAQTYLNHPILGNRLVECTKIMLSHLDTSAEQILGHIDSQKFRSSMTLFSLSSPQILIFDQAIKKYYAGKIDPRTKNLLNL